MAQEILHQTLEIPEDRASGDRSAEDSGDPALSRTASSSRLNAKAPEFVPRSAAADRIDARKPRVVPIHHGPSPVMHPYHPAPPSPPFFATVPGSFEYYGGGGGSGFGEQETAPGPAEQDPAPGGREGLSEEVIQKITKQVEYYFSDVNLATTEHLMRFISKDPEGFVPISVIAAFKKIKSLVHNNSLLAMALRTSSKLVVSDDGKKIRRQLPFTELDVEELQSRIVVAENLPEDHCYQNLMKVFSAVGSVKTIRTCYPQTTNGTNAQTNKPAKLDMLFGNRLHAFVEYETVEDAEKAVAELNDERNWRSGLRVRLLLKCMTKHGPGRGRKGGHEGDVDGEDDVSTSNLPNEKQVEDPSQISEASHDNVGEALLNERDGGLRRGRGRGWGGRGRGRGQYNSNRNGGHMVGTPPSSHPIHTEQSVVANRQPPGPRMPDGTRGFTMGRGKLVTPASMV
ncbi:la-related protein 6B-like [Phoenix dactylifera]|uniref:La-related protein 6B-like n=1 Tax=Phoenix dactylifera TaxID=42345 RepID=A0A8B8ZYV6_PHODC|nr:la-related protein 6B-like [Phoenix dactylifera]